MLGAITAIEEKLDFHPNRKNNYSGTEPLLTPETYHVLNVKYG